LPPEDQSEEQTRPWVTDELLERTVKLWSAVYGRRVSVQEAMEMVKRVGRLIELAHSVSESS
jgi:hypothetical protein